MNNRIITDISNYIFVSDEPEKVDAIFLPGGSHPEQPEYAAELYRKGYAKWLVPSGGVSVKRDKWPGVRSNAEIYNGDYKTDCEFFTDVLIKSGVPRTAIYGEDTTELARALPTELFPQFPLSVLTISQLFPDCGCKGSAFF